MRARGEATGPRQRCHVAGAVQQWQHRAQTTEVIHMLQSHPCARCGRDDAALGFGTTWLCEDCYGTVGSCCMEFDGDDMGLEDRTWWESRMEPKG
jgi:hypothetical protein